MSRKKYMVSGLVFELQSDIACATSPRRLARHRISEFFACRARKRGFHHSIVSRWCRIVANCQQWSPDWNPYAGALLGIDFRCARRPATPMLRDIRKFAGNPKNEGCRADFGFLENTIFAAESEIVAFHTHRFCKVLRVFWKNPRYSFWEKNLWRDIAKNCRAGCRAGNGHVAQWFRGRESTPIPEIKSSGPVDRPTYPVFSDWPSSRGDRAPQRR